MKSFRRFSIFIAVAVFVTAGITVSTPPASPSLEPELFGRDTLTLPDYHNSLTDLSEREGMLFLTRSNRDFSSSAIYISHSSNGQWNQSEVAPFSDGVSDSGGSLTPDGSRLYFTSKRPTGLDGIGDAWNLWMAERTADGWGHAKPLGRPANTEHSECCLTAKAAGVVYFSSNREGSWDVYRGEVRDGDIERIEKLEGGPNTEHDEWPSYVDPQERFLLFSSIRPGGEGGDDLYISYRREGGWSEAVNLGPVVNSKAFEDSATLSADGGYLYFSSSRGGFSQIFRVRAEEIEALTP